MPQPQTVAFGALVRELRAEHGWSLRDLGERIVFHRSYVGRVEIGEKLPDRRFAELADRALAAGGCIVDAWEREHEARARSEATGRLLTASVTDSLRLIEATSDSAGDLDTLHESAARLAVTYLSSPPAPMLIEAVELRAELLRRLHQHDYRSRQASDLLMTLGRVQGVLSYAALDLGRPDAAMTHATAAWMCGERIGSNELRAWVRGTQSLISRFDQHYVAAEQLALTGLQYPVVGTGRLRLLAGLAQSRANLGNSSGAIGALDMAERERAVLTTDDEIGGLFEFSRAKQYYYAGSSLMWLPGRTDLQRAARDATQAYTIWEDEPPASRSLDDEALAHIYAATAYTRLGDLDAAQSAVAPILTLPDDRLISWILRRLRNLAEIVSHEFPGSHAASEFQDSILRVAS